MHTRAESDGRWVLGESPPQSRHSGKWSKPTVSTLFWGGDQQPLVRVGKLVGKKGNRGTGGG
jgi:hypothetical protein